MILDNIIQRDIKTLNTKKLSKIGAAFVCCENLKAINMPLVSSVAAEAFYKCKNLVSVNLPAATNIRNYAFYSCRSLSMINLPAATSVGYNTFACCLDLSMVNLPAATSIGNSAFAYCQNLTNIYIRNNSICSIASSTFYSTPIDKTYSVNGEYGRIYVPFSLVDQYKSASYWSAYSDRIFSLGTLISFTGNTENNIYYQNDKEVAEVYGDGLTQFDIYNKKWGKLSVTINNVEYSETPLEYNIVSPTNYKTVTIKNTSSQIFDSYTVKYDNISFTCTSFPDSIGVPVNTKISISALNDSYQVEISNLEITNNTTIDFANYLKNATYTIVNITANNANQYPTFIDGYNFEVANGRIQNGNKTYGTQNSESLGYIEIDTPNFNSNLIIDYSVDTDSRNYCYAYLSTTKSISNDKQIFANSGYENFPRTKTITLKANTHYYLYFQLFKYPTNTSGYDRFYIDRISFVQAK